MKKQYEAPKAEKVEFDYKESVAACSEWPDCKKASEVSQPYWECKSPDYFNC